MGGEKENIEVMVVVWKGNSAYWIFFLFILFLDD